MLSWHVHQLALALKLNKAGVVQGGTLYGLWGTLLVAYGIVFSTAIDLLGAHGLAPRHCIHYTQEVSHT